MSDFITSQDPGQHPCGSQPEANAPATAPLAGPYLLVKRGLYYRPNSHGYTGIKDYAGRYTLAEALDHEDDISGVTAVREADAPMFSERCLDDVARIHLTNKLAVAEAELSGWKAEAERLRKVWAAEAMAEPVTLAHFHRHSGGADALLTLMFNMGALATTPEAQP